VSEANLAALLGSKATPTEPPRIEPPQEVETALPLLAASDAHRAGSAVLAGPELATGERAYSRSRVTLVAIGGVIAVAGLSAFLLRDRWLTAPKAATPARAASFPLQVQVEPQGNGLINIRWNSQSEPVAQARDGRLLITERDQQPRIVTLAPEQLRIGHLYYQTSADRIEFRLEVVDRSGAIAQESVLAVSPGTVAAPPAPAPPPTSTDAKAAVPQVAKAVETPQPSRPVIRTFTLPASTQTSTEPGRVILPDDAPAPVAGGSGPPPAVGLPAALDRIPAPPVKQAPAQSKQIRVGGNIQAANLIRRVTPVYPPVAKAARIQGIVRFTATIAKNGTIQNLQVISGQPVLVPAAAEAVKQWVYRPVLLNGEPVEVITQIEVNFDLNQ